MYYYAELQNEQSISKPEQLKANTLKGAKIAASNLQGFKNSVLAIYDDYERIAIKDKDGVWRDEDYGKCGIGEISLY